MWRIRDQPRFDWKRSKKNSRWYHAETKGDSKLKFIKTQETTPNEKIKLVRSKMRGEEKSGNENPGALYCMMKL